MYHSGAVRSLTFKATEFGPNITKDQAIANSAAWTPTELPTTIDLPTADWSEPPPTPSDAGSSASHAATPPSAGRGRGAGRGAGRAGRGA